MSATPLSDKHSVMVELLNRLFVRPAAFVAACGVSLVDRVRSTFVPTAIDKNSLRATRRLEKQRRKELWRKERTSRH